MNEENPYAGLQLSQLIDLLEPITEVPRPSMMPQTGGWIVVALLLLAGAVFTAYRTIQHRRANAYRRFALDAVQSAGDDPVALAQILRLTALSAYPRAQIAGLSGPDWLRFLDNSADVTGFVDGPGAVLATAPYTPAAKDPKLTDLVTRWIRRHDPQKGLV